MGIKLLEKILLFFESKNFDDIFTITFQYHMYLKQINSKRKIYGCDTFEGLPYEDKFSKKTSENLIGNFPIH